MYKKTMLMVLVLVLTLSSVALGLEKYAEVDFRRPVSGRAVTDTGEIFLLNEHVLFGFYDRNDVFAFKVTDDFKDQLDKYFEWEKTATENEVEIEREIGEFHSLMFSGENIIFEAKTYIFSQSPTRHQFVIEFGRTYGMEPPHNEYNDIRPLYFEFKDVKKLRYWVSDEGVEEGKEIIAEKEEVDALFD